MLKPNINTTKVLKIVWMALCIHTFFLYFTNESAWSNGELYTLYFFRISALTFPFGPFVAIAAEATLDELAKFGFNLSGYFSHQITVAILWLTMAAAGFTQWFVVLPTFYKWLRKKISRDNHPYT